MKKAFTLVEMLVVIGILGILVGVLITTVSGGSDSARAARCLTNMRNLAAGCQSYAMVHSCYPLAGSIERFTMDVSQGKRNMKNKFSDVPGWISWFSQNAYQNAQSSKAQSSWTPSMYDSNRESRQFALTNGALWKYVSSSREIFICPQHAITKKHLDPNFSYVMNAYFGWTARPGTDYYDGSYSGIEYGRFNRADRFLLFAEIPFSDVGVASKESMTGLDCDPILQYQGLENCAQNECIGFNHKSGKNSYYGHVVFADGHVEKLTYPKGGLSESEIQQLTTWLCTGVDVTFDGTRYDELK